MPEERCCSYEIAIVGHLLTLIHREHERINRRLVNIAATLVVENEGLGRSELNFAAILDACELTDSLINISFVENSVCLPEDKDGVLSLIQLGVAKRADGAPEFLSDQVINACKKFFHLCF